MKLGWKLVTHRDALWVRVVRDKYQCGEDLLPRFSSKRPSSNVWTGIKKTWDKVLGGLEVDQVHQAVKWKGERHGEFSVKSAYRVLSGEVGDSGIDWSRIWKVRAPQRCKTLLWLLTRKSLLTNACRMRRGLTLDAGCPVCKAGLEDIMHVFRDCMYSKALWRKVVGQSRWRRFCTMNLSDWVWWNLRGNSENCRQWASKFTVLCWGLWHRRNLFVFEKKFLPVDTILASAGAMVGSLTRTNDRLAGLQLQGVTLAPSRESWRPPEGDWVKVNVDGASSARAMKSACGGLIRNNAGSFIKGFIHPIEGGDELHAEIWACLLGLKMAWTMGFKKVWLETDSTECLDLVLHGCRAAHRDSGIIHKVSLMLAMDWETRITYVPRSCNSAADFLAKSGLGLGIGLREVYQPPVALEVLLSSDCNRGMIPIYG